MNKNIKRVVAQSHTETAKDKTQIKLDLIYDKAEELMKQRTMINMELKKLDKQAQRIRGEI